MKILPCLIIALLSFGTAEAALPPEQINKITQFMNTKFQDAIDKGNYYLLKKQTGLACDIEYDPETKLHFFHTEEVLGKGCLKIVKKSFLYDGKNFHPVAKAVFRIPGKESREVEILTKIKQLPHVVRLIASPVHKENGKKIQEIITRLYPLGTLKNLVLKETLSIKEKISLAKDLMEALKELHALNIQHYDIHEENILLQHSTQTKNVKYGLILADFGAASQSEDAHFRERDIYAAGCTLYGLFHNCGYTKELYDKLNHKKQSITQSKALTARKNELLRKKPLGPSDSLELIILKMLHPAQHKKEAAGWFQELSTLLNSVN